MNRDPLSDICTNTHNLRRGRKQKHRGNVKNNKKLILNTGRWEEFEKVAFLEGIRIHGTGKWKLISSLIPTRNAVQVKSHAQQMMQKRDRGINIFEKLDANYMKSDVCSKRDMQAAKCLVSMASEKW